MNWILAYWLIVFAYVFGRLDTAREKFDRNAIDLSELHLTYERPQLFLRCLRAYL